MNLHSSLSSLFLFLPEWLSQPPLSCSSPFPPPATTKTLQESRIIVMTLGTGAFKWHDSHAYRNSGRKPSLGRKGGRIRPGENFAVHKYSGGSSPSKLGSSESIRLLMGFLCRKIVSLHFSFLFRDPLPFFLCLFLACSPARVLYLPN